jgi:histidine kinase
MSHLIIVVVGGIVLFTAAELVMPQAFERHVAHMAVHMGDDPSMRADLFSSFRRALTESVLAATVTSLLIAIGLSFYVSRRVVRRVEEMTRSSRRIAAGHYDERLALDDLERSGEMDELGQLATSFNQMAAALETTESHRRDLIGNVAHELRTPLTSIKGYMEGLMDGLLPAEAPTFARVYREADRLQRLVSDLQELSRVEAGALPLERRPLALRDLVAATAERLRPQFDEKGVELAISVPTDLVPVLGDEDRLNQVLTNLLGNALQYTPSGGRVDVGATRHGRAVRVSVRDNGIGVSAEHLPRLFDRFYRAEDSRSRAGGGSGIGLTIARHLVQAHGGEIGAHSEGPGKGAEFWFTLPVA